MICPDENNYPNTKVINMLKKSVSYAGSAALVLLLAACASQQPAPVVVGTQSGGSTTSSTADNPYGAAPYNTNTSPAADAPYTPPASTPAPTYNSGSTNNLADNTISIGQTLRVKPEGYVAPAASASKPSTPTTTTTAPAPSTPANTPTVSTGSSRNVSGITWQRPTTGNVIANFGGSNKGVDIAGTQGQPVVAAADGKVVYAGSGLRGYGNLVIIQHNSSFLSAYGHNQRLLVNENQTVKRGQTIAHMGNTDASRTQLHFEIRQNGKPVNPANYVAF